MKDLKLEQEDEAIAKIARGALGNYANAKWRDSSDEEYRNRISKVGVKEFVEGFLESNSGIGLPPSAQKQDYLEQQARLI
ncbi:MULTISPECIES: hypothetical protein [unclassified Pseudomonas]|uniref:hypothetical protein n=1 Tax=unclassified Pseudomonas TaxID=196821 RepID=UPI003CF5E648